MTDIALLVDGLFVTRSEWMQSAACKGETVDRFFNPPGTVPFEALALCYRCPVRQDCLDYAVENRIEHGLWGGLTAKQRIDSRRGHVPVVVDRQMFPVEVRSGIVARFAAGMTMKEIAVEFECSQRTVNRVLKRERAI
jgi:WhiB family redox-sensing transcriptional regulator